jgi:hypothetical protein
MGSEPKSRFVIHKPLQKALYNPRSMLDYVIVIVGPLVSARLIDAIILETGIDITRVRRGFLTVELRSLVTYVPAQSEGVFSEILRKYGPTVDAWFGSLSNDIDKLNELLLKGLNGEASEQELCLLGHFFGDLQGEVASFIRRADKYSVKQQEEFLIKYVSIGFQRAADRVVQRLARDGAVLRDTGALPGTLRLVWLPQQGRGIYDMPNGKVQVLSLLKSVMPGLIDFSTDESEYTRVARLALALGDDRDVDALINLIAKAYLGPGDAPRQWVRPDVPKKYAPLLLLSYILSRERGAFSFIDFEGDTPITVTYPKIPFTEVGGQ